MTEAGRRHIAEWGPADDMAGQDAAEFRVSVAAIEAEARADLARRIEALHEPTSGMGWRADGKYDLMEPVCSSCGTADEYGVPWPCSTILAVRQEAAK